MKYSKVLIVILLAVLYSCKKGNNHNFKVSGNIKGLTKGTIYLDRVIDTLIVPVDSFFVEDDGNFKLGANLESAEIFYVYLKEIPTERLLIFGEQGAMHINSKLEKFVYSAKVTGSENHNLLKEHEEMMRNFNNSRMDLFKANLEAEQKLDSIALDSLDAEYKSLIRRRYLYTTNFSVKHADKEIAPYLALTELYDANLSLLDTINNSLSEEIKNTNYGKEFDRFITVIRNQEE